MSDEAASVSQQGRNASRIRKKRLRGACDACRIRKTKCDSAESPMNICSSCITNKVRCRHEMPRYQKLIDRHEEAIDYIGSLQDRIQKLENYIQRIHPGQDIDRIINEPDSLSPPANANASSSSSSSSSGIYGSISLKYPSNVDPRTNAPTYSTPENDDDQLEQDELDEISLSKDLKNLSTSDPADVRFFGQASSVMLAKHVTDVKKEITGDFDIVLSSKYRRPIYWNLSSWELPYINDLETVYIYPEYDLLTELITIYFEKVNNLIPLLHKPTFMESVKSGQHHWDPSFGMVVLLVCAHGAKYSKDPRVFMPDDSIGLSSGWKYFSQVPLHRKQLLYKSTLYDLQYYALASMFLVGTSMPYACWNFAVIGLRYAYEKGIHRRQGQGNTPTVESELLKRAFWTLVCIDCCSSSFVGRTCTMHEAHDVEYLIECDDEYWETGDPETAFKQPQGKPCSISAFNYFIKLCEILGFALRTLYANKKSKSLLGFIGPDWEGKMVAELDSSINKWSEDLPEHLRWDPHRKDTAVFNQTVNLHLFYYYIQIQIHRPYLIKKSSLTLPSLAMCNNAARSCTRILEASLARGTCVLPNAVAIAYTAGMVITFNLLAASRSTGQAGGSKEDIENLQKCINYLQQIENRWYSAGKLLDSLREAGDIPQRGSWLSSPASSSDGPPTGQSEPTYLRQSVTEMSSAMVNDLSTSSNVSGSNDYALNNWDLQRMLLVEMGYLPNELAPITTSIASSSLFPENPQLQNSAGILQSNDGVNAFTQTVNGAFSPLSDATNFVNFEEWNRYLSPMGRL